MKILLVDTSPTIRNLQKNTLLGMGHTDVLEAADGVEALSVLQDQKPDLVLSCFIYAHLDDMIMRHCAAIDELDYFGIDGLCRPNPGTYPRFKTVFGNIDRALAACRAANVKSFCLVETGAGIPLEQTIGYVKDVLKTPIDHLLYYYFGS